MIQLIYILLLLNVFQLVFWSRQVQKLVDKLMSRSYFEYIGAQGKKEPEMKIKITDEDQEKVNLGDFRI
jgi:hypothetical protein